MSMLNDGREVRCDGARCDGARCAAEANWPIALHPVERDGYSDARPAAGWVSVTGSREARHFCPACAVIFLRSVSNDLPSAGKAGHRTKTAGLHAR